MELKDKLRILRVLKGLRQEDVAEKLGVMRSVVARHEGGTMVPRERMLEKYAKILGMVSVDWLQGRSISPFKFDVFRPLSPTSSYTTTALRTVASELNKLPELLEIIDINKLHVLKSGLGLILMAISSHTILVIIARYEICDDLLKQLPKQYRTDKPISNDLFSEAILNPSQKINEIMELCKIKLNADPVAICRDYNPPTEGSLCVSFKVNVIDGNPEMEKQIENILVNSGIRVISVEALNHYQPRVNLDPELRKKWGI